MNPHGLANIFGRFLLALIFLVSAYGKIADWQGAINFMAEKGIPSPEVLLPIALVVEVLGSLMLIVGFKAQWAALALVVFLIPATYYFHDFWKMPQETAEENIRRQNQIVLFLKNVSIAGGLIIVAARGAGPGSIDEPRNIGPSI
jgi:putative oxidoreductase